MNPERTASPRDRELGLSETVLAPELLALAETEELEPPYLSLAIELAHLIKDLAEENDSKL